MKLQLFTGFKLTSERKFLCFILTKACDTRSLSSKTSETKYSKHFCRSQMLMHVFNLFLFEKNH